MRAADHLFHQFLVHRFPSGVARRTLLSTADLRLARLHRCGVGHPARVVTVVVAPAGFRFLALGPTASPLALLRISSALRSAPLSRRLGATTAAADSSPALTREVSPGKLPERSQRAVRFYRARLAARWTSLFLASLSPASGLTSGACSCGRRLAGCCFRLAPRGCALQFGYACSHQLRSVPCI